ncbi:MAG TPA: hypothetical protein VJ735_20150 [Actinomycetes bacterium]|nr:hypothetical protein [Actinomycetes bacterium]
MKVKLLKIMAGPVYAGSPGDVLDVPDDLGAQLIDGRYAEDLAPPATDVETADAVPEGEEAVEHKRKKGRRG